MPIPPQLFGALRILQLAGLGLSLLLTSCAQYATVAETKPRFRLIGNAADGKIFPSLRNFRHDPLATLGAYLTTAEAAATELTRNPKDEAAQAHYNFAVARAISTIRDGKLDPWTRPLRVPAAHGEYVLDHRPDHREAWNPTLYRFTPVDELKIKGTYVSQQMSKPGVGAPLVATGLDKNRNARRDFAIDRTFYGVTAVANFSGRRCTISFEDPLTTESVTLQGRRFPLAANFTAPLAVMLASNNPKSLELTRLLRPQKYAETARIARLQPYDPNKTVVLVIHGLADTPATWAPMLNSLRSDERIRRHYQFWFYSYPSGYPYPYSAAILRQELDGVEKRFPLRHPMIVIGHSMGGCISRLLITDPGEKLWLEYFGKPPAKVQLSPESKSLLTEAIIFRHRPEVDRVIFISTPHRGSDLASGWIGRFGSSLVKSPRTLLGVGREAAKAMITRGDSLKLKRIPNSVDTLAPNNRFVLAVNTIPLTPGIPYHSIMGDRGKGGHKDRTRPVCSDGVVPYWSSHLDRAQSELIVPSAHNAHQNPQAIAEVRRILNAQAGR